MTDSRKQVRFFCISFMLPPYKRVWLVLYYWCSVRNWINKMHLKPRDVPGSNRSLSAGLSPTPLQDSPRLLAQQPPPRTRRVNKHHSWQTPNVTETNQDVSAGNWDPSVGAINLSHPDWMSCALKDCRALNGFSLSTSQCGLGGQSYWEVKPSKERRWKLWVWTRWGKKSSNWTGWYIMQFDILRVVIFELCKCATERFTEGEQLPFTGRVKQNWLNSEVSRKTVWQGSWELKQQLHFLLQKRYCLF